LSRLQGTRLLSRNSGRSSRNRRKPSKPHLLVSSSKNSKAGTQVLTVYIRIKLQVDLLADKSFVVVKGPFFHQV
jgi:hypothetical protein